MFIGTAYPRNLFAPEERDVGSECNTLRSSGAKKYVRQQAAINIWPLCGQDITRDLLRERFALRAQADRMSAIRLESGH